MYLSSPFTNLLKNVAYMTDKQSGDMYLSKAVEIQNKNTTFYKRIYNS